MHTRARIAVSRSIARLHKAPQWLTLFAQRLRFPADGKRCLSLTTSMDLAQHQTLRVLLGFEPAFHSRLLRSGAQTYYGWGRKWSGRRAVAIAAQAGAGFQLLEDGFLRSVGRRDTSVSLVFDDTGIYYDASAPSQLEAMVSAPLEPDEEARARDLIALWRGYRLSKYNAAPDFTGDLPAGYVLVVDQVAGDLSIGCGLADQASFAQMLDAALAEYPDKTVVVKLHPDALRNKGASHFNPAALVRNPRIRVIAGNAHAAGLIEHADAVYTVTSQVGFEALIWGKKVRTFGMPFYAGWGLTKDALPAPRRRSRATLEQLVYAALVRYARYIDPVTMKPCEVEQAIRHVALQRHLHLAFPEKITGVGFSRWKRPFIANFLTGSKVTFAKQITTPGADPAAETFAVWGSARHSHLPDAAKILRIEDGFLRSSGLGADLVRPLSLVIDDVGIYYDATRPSRLENILNTQVLTAEQCGRARRLREEIVTLGLTKYNIGNKSWSRPKNRKRVILVVGQVESDASIVFGSPDVKTNAGLLERVRSLHPDAFIVYKPHPDVLAGLRKHGQGDVLNYCDEILTANVAPDSLFHQIDELHTMTSLMGFEALMRGVRVTCHGLPFYAGWGLTTDLITCERRERHLTIDELVCGVLISYPRYFCYRSGCFVEPEHTLGELAEWARSGPSTRTWYRKLLRLLIVTWLKVKGSEK